MRLAVDRAMFLTTMDLILSTDDRRVLMGMLRATTISAGLARRARVILALADGQSYAEIAGRDGYVHRSVEATRRGRRIARAQ